jgi:DNA-binding transcriptional regulator YiaG
MIVLPLPSLGELSACAYYVPYGIWQNWQMPNIAAIFKSEISRLARKEVRSEIESLRKAANAYRSDIAALKRRTQSLEQALKANSKIRPVNLEKAVEEAPSKSIRFSAKGLASHRKRLDLSAEDLGLLLNTSSQSIYNWESGAARPRAKHLPAISALKTLGKKDALAILSRLKTAAN